jgi:HK97 family phage prohead protease
MTMEPFDIVRATSEPPELRRDSDDGLGTLTGHFSIFDSWYPVTSTWEGDFLERVAPGAFTQTIAEDTSRMRVLFDHGYDPQIGNKVLGSIESLAEDDTGPAYQVRLLDTGYNRDLVPGLRAGVYGASFRFRVRQESWVDEPDSSDVNPKGLPERTVTNAKVMEFGPVTFPANPEATAGIRSLTDQFYDRLRARDTSAYQAAARAAGLPILTGADAARSSSRGDNQTRNRVFLLRKKINQWT